MKKRTARISTLTVIGVDVGGTKIAAGTVLIGKNTKLIDVIEIPIKANASAHNVFTQICTVIDFLNSKKVGAICVGFPGIVNPKSGAVLFATNIPKFKNIPLKKWLIEKYNKKVFVQNDAKCFALGQFSTLKSKRDKNIVGLILGTGVGAGIIVNRKIVTGIDGSEGEVGAWISSSGKSFEKTLGGHDFVKQFHTPGLKLFEQAKHGDARARKLFVSYGEHLAELIAMITVTYAPQQIILGGSVSKSAKFFLPATKKQLHAFCPDIKLPQIVVAKKKYAGVIGAAELASQE